MLAPAARADPARELSEGNALKRVNACPPAIAHYLAALNEARPGSGLWEAAAYNQALCLEELERLDEAIAVYSDIVRQSPSEPAVADALFRRGVAWAQIGDPGPARADFRRARRRVKEASAHLRIDVQLGSLDAAAGRRLRAVTRLGQAAVALRDAVDEHPDERWYLAQALVGLGDLHRRESIKALPRGSLARLTEALGVRAESLAVAQGFYVEAAQQRQPAWTAAATLHLGEAYQSLNQQLVDLRRAPGRLSEFERAGLTAWIDARSIDLLRKARDSFRLCEDVFTEMGLDDRSTRACREAVEMFDAEPRYGPTRPRSESPSPAPR